MSVSIQSGRGGGGGGILQQVIVVGTTSGPTTTTSTITVTVPQMTYSFTPLEANSLICIEFHTTCSCTQKEDPIRFEVDIDGTNETDWATETVSANASIATAVYLVCWKDDLTAAAHTIKIEWGIPDNSGTATCKGIERHMVITEYKAP